MQYNSIISELFNETASQAELICPSGEQYRDLWKTKEKIEAQLLETFSEEQKQMYKEMEDARFNGEFMYSEEAFRRGVALGVRVVAESLLIE